MKNSKSKPTIIQKKERKFENRQLLQTSFY